MKFVKIHSLGESFRLSENFDRFPQTADMRNSFGNALVELAPPRIDREYIVACGYNLRAIDTVMLVSVGFETGDKFKRDCNTCLYEANNFARATDLEVRLQINC